MTVARVVTGPVPVMHVFEAQQLQNIDGRDVPGQAAPPLHPFIHRHR